MSKEFIEPSLDYTYNVNPIGEYNDQSIDKIKKISLLIGEIHEIQLKRDASSQPSFTISYDNIDEVEMIDYERGFKGILRLRDNKALSISVVNSEGLPYLEPSFTKSLGHKIGICILLYVDESISGRYKIIELLQTLKNIGNDKKKYPSTLGFSSWSNCM